MRLPSIVLEIVAGIVIGPAVLGWVEVDEPIEVLNLIGLRSCSSSLGSKSTSGACGDGWFDFRRWGTSSRSRSRSPCLALKAGDLIETPLLVAIILASTSLGVIIPVLKDAGETSCSSASS